MTLTCPKCQAAMRTYERNGVHLDQCTECRGLFLDRGELERLIDAETAYYDGGPSSQSPSQSSSAQAARAGATSTASSSASSSDLGRLASEVLKQVGSARSSSHASSGYGSPKKKKSFLDQLLG